MILSIIYKLLYKHDNPHKVLYMRQCLADKYLYYIKEVRQIKMNEGMNTEEVVYLDEKMEKLRRKSFRST